MTDTTEATGVSFVAPAELHESPDNPRAIRDDRFDALKAALEHDPAMLLPRPIIATPNGEVVAGNMRLRAARDMLADRERYPQFHEFTERHGGVPAYLVPLDEKRKREWILRDNAPYGDWEQDALADFIREYDDLDGSDRRMLGLEDDAIKRVLNESDGGGGASGGETGAAELWGVVVECEDEEAQTGLLERLSDEGFRVRALL